MATAQIDRSKISLDMRVGGLQCQIEIGPDVGAERVAPDHAVVDNPSLLISASTDDLKLNPIPLHVNTRGQHDDTGGKFRAPGFAAVHEWTGGHGVAGLVLPETRLGW